MPNPYDEEQNRRHAQRYPYSGSGPRYQNQYDRYHKGDSVPQIPWWVIILTFIMGIWPVSIALAIINLLLRSGSLGYDRSTRQVNWKGRPVGTPPLDAKPVYDTPPEAPAQKKTPAPSKSTSRRETDTAANVLMIIGIAVGCVGLLAAGDALFMMIGSSYPLVWLEDLLVGGFFTLGGFGMLFGGHRMRVSRRLRKKIDNIVGNADHMAVQDIAASIPCSYEKCCKALEDCIDRGMFGEDAYLDMRTRTLVVRGEPPEAAPAPEAPPEPVQESQYDEILTKLRKLNDAIPGEESSDKISRLEAVSAKIFDQAQNSPEKLPQMRRFLDYYLPTSLKLLETYAELDAQGIEGENIRESKRRIEEAMDTLVVAFENQLDQLFRSDALDVSTDIDVMENMLRADGLTGSDPFDLSTK